MHAPPDYRCPFCAIVQELEADYSHTSQAEVVLRDTSSSPRPAHTDNAACT